MAADRYASLETASYVEADFELGAEREHEPEFEHDEIFEDPEPSEDREPETVEEKARRAVYDEKGGKPEEWEPNEPNSTENANIFTGSELLAADGSSITKQIERMNDTRALENHQLFLDHLRYQTNEAFVFPDFVEETRTERIHHVIVGIADAEGNVSYMAYLRREAKEHIEEEEPDTYEIEIDEAPTTKEEIPEETILTVEEKSVVKEEQREDRIVEAEERGVEPQQEEKSKSRLASQDERLSVELRSLFAEAMPALEEQKQETEPPPEVTLEEEPMSAVHVSEVGVEPVVLGERKATVETVVPPSPKREEFAPLLSETEAHTEKQEATRPAVNEELVFPAEQKVENVNQETSNTREDVEAAQTLVTEKDNTTSEPETVGVREVQSTVDEPTQPREINETTPSVESKEEKAEEPIFDTVEPTLQSVGVESPEQHVEQPREVIATESSSTPRREPVLARGMPAEWLISRAHGANLQSTALHTDDATAEPPRTPFSRGGIRMRSITTYE